MSGIALTGLAGNNPLSFLAAMGVLNVLSDRNDSDTATLCWVDRSGWRPQVEHSDLDGGRDRLVQLCAEDLKTWRDDPAIQLRYSKPSGGKGAWDLKPPPAHFRAYVGRLLGISRPEARRAVDLAAAFATDVVVDQNGNTKPTALHFTAGQQEFLRMVNELVGGVTADDLVEALFGPWRYTRSLPVLQWDSTANRDYALRASDPSGDKKKGVPGADWLAFRGLSFLWVAPRAGQRRPGVATTGCFGGWKDGGFRWPIWTDPLRRPAVRTLLQHPGLESLGEPERRARGIALIYESKIKRSDQGGYGSFSPAAVR